MRVPRLFLAKIDVGEATLSREESAHAARVLALREGAEVEVFDGAGVVGSARVRSVARGAVEVWVHDARRAQPESRPYLTIHVAPPKGDRQQILVEKCTEIGVSALGPLQTGRGVVLPSDALYARWRRWALEACKQCGRAWAPVILPSDTPQRAFPTDASDTLAMIAHPDAALPLSEVLSSRPNAERVTVFIGPEGGWTDQELEWADRATLQRVRLGASILRIETAAIVATTLIRLHPPCGVHLSPASPGPADP